jgi:hypothetical protein
VILIVVSMLLALRVALARRPVLIGCHTLLLLLGLAGAVDLLLPALRGSTLPSGTLLVVISVAILYPAAARAAVASRASVDELKGALLRSARMIRLGAEGGPRRYRLTSGASSATLTVLGGPTGWWVLILGGETRAAKVKLFRRVVAKQFGGLIPIFWRVRT